MRESNRWTLILAVIIVLAALGWAAKTIYGKVAQNRRTMTNIVEEQEGWAHYHEQQALAEQYESWSMELDPRDYMADTAINSAYDFSCTMGVYNQDLSPLMISAALKSMEYRVGGTHFYIEDMTTAGGWPPGIVPPGGNPGVDGFVFKAWWDDDSWDPAICPEVINNSYGPGALWKWVSAPDWSWEIPLVFSATGTHIDSTRGTKVFMGSDTGPTHSNEVVGADVWEADVACGTVAWEFGGMGSNKPNCGGCVGDAPITPGTGMFFAGMLHKAATGTIVYGRWKDIEVSNGELDLDALEDVWPGGCRNFTVGRGANLEIEHRALGFVANINWSNVIVPPLMANYTELGNGKYSIDAHHPDYDDILVWIWDLHAVCPEWQKGGACFPPPGFYPHPFASDGGVMPAYDYGVNPLDMICPFCGSQLRPNGMKKVDYIGSWPDTSETDWVSVGAFDDCTSAPMTWGNIHSVFDPYTQLVAPYGGWDKKTDYLYACEMWNGACAFLYDRTSLIKHKLPVCSFPVHIFGEGPLSRTDNCSSPKFSAKAKLNDTDFDLGGPLGHRASAWESAEFAVAGGGVGTSGNVSFTVPAGGGALYRDLIDIWLPRCQHMIAGPCFADFGTAARYHQANTGVVWGCGWGLDPDHDVFDFSAYRHIQYEASASAEPENEPQLRITYHIATVTNNHNTPAGWAASVSLGPAETETFTGEYDHANSIIWFDLGLVAGGEQRPWMKHVSKVELIFAEEAAPIAWTFTQVGRLVKQNDNDPNRDEITPPPPTLPNHVKTTFHEPTSIYAVYKAGGMRARTDGAKDTLWTVEQFRVYSGHEKLVEHINWQFGNPSGLDLSGAFSLGGYCAVIEESTQGWAWGLPDNWNAMTVDDDGDVFTIGYSFDFMELPLYIPDDEPDGACDCMFKIFSKALVPGILNKPYGIVGVQGGIHGLSKRRDVEDLARIERREAGSADDWLEHARSDSDAHGYWWFGADELPPNFPTSGGDIVHHYTGVVPTYWAYRVGKIIIPRLYERQWEQGLVGRIGHLALTQHFSGAILVTDVGLTTPSNVGEHKIQRVVGWSQRFAVPDSEEANWANILTMDSRMELIEGQGNVQTRRMHSLDGDWQAEQILEAGYSAPYGIEVGGRFYICAYKDEKQYLLRRDRAAAHAEVSPVIEIAASDDMAASLAYIDTQRRLLCALQSDSALNLYQSFDQGQTWSLKHSLASLEYPYIFAEADRVWLLGFADDNAKVASYYSHTEALDEAMALAEVGQADDGRSAIIRNATTRELTVVSPKTTDWGLAAPNPAIVEYVSSDTGQTWTRKAFHGLT